MSQRQKLQNAHCTRFLNYGHLGTLTYHEDNQTWRTSRIVKPHVATAALGEIGDGDNHSAFPLRHASTKVVYDGSTVPKYLTQSQNSQSDHGYSDEFGSGPSKSHASNATKVASSGKPYDGSQIDAGVLAAKDYPNCSHLLAFGCALPAAWEGARADLVCVPIGASVSGGTAESVRLVRVEEEIFEYRDTSSYVPCMSIEDEAYWTSSGGPIQQVCFAAATGYSSTWMAARLQTSTTIFHPLIHQNPVPARYEMSQPPLSRKRSSVLDANPLLTIPISRTGGHPHAHIAFHPRNHLKLALIDEHGNWSVWVIFGEHQQPSRCRFRVKLHCCGKLWTWDHEKRLRTSFPYHDGWHRVLWSIPLGNSSDDLFLLNRRTAAVYDISGHLRSLPDFQLGHARENRLILDVQSSKVVPGHYFVLTSTRLFWINLEGNAFGGSGIDASNLHVLLAWQHFRPNEDRTLHLVLLETGTTTIILIASRVVDLVSAFQFGMIDQKGNIPVSLADPVSMFLPVHPRHIYSRCRPLSLSFCAIESHCRSEILENRPYSFFKLFSLYEDLTVLEHLYSSTQPDFRPTLRAAESFVLSLPIRKPLRKRSLKHYDNRHCVDFIVPDDWVDEDSDPAAVGHRRGIEQAWKTSSLVRGRLTLDWQDVYAVLAEESKSSALKDRIAMNDLRKQFSAQLHLRVPSGKRLLSETLSSKLYITDVDHDSDQFERLSKAFDLQHGPDMRLERLPTFTSDSSESDNLISLYDAVIANYLTPLSSQAADRIRVNKERLARRVAADLLLASTATCSVSRRTSKVSDPEIAPSNSQPITSSISLPTTSQLTDPSSQPTLLTFMTSLTTPASPTVEDPILTRLRTYTTITHPPTSTHTSPLLTTNPIMTSLLRHLPTSPHTDPATYSWRTTERTLAAEAQLANATTHTDPRSRRKAEKARLARIRREEARRRTAEEMASSQRFPPTVLSSSQFPGNAVGLGFGGGSGSGVGVGYGSGIGTGVGFRGEGGVQSSQPRAPAWDVGIGSSQGQTSLGVGWGAGAGVENEMAMTQPERGEFGTRPGVGTSAALTRKAGKGKGKKRAAGF